MPGAYLETMTWPEAEAALAETPLVLLPLGSRLKEHGPHLPLNNDWLLAEHLTRRVVERCDVLAAPTIQYHYYPALADYPGSTHIRRQPATEMVIDLVRSFTRHGARRCYVLNTGISTCWALEPARQRLLEEELVMDYTDLSVAVADVEEEVSEQERGTHADELETSMMLYLAPDVVRLERAVRDDNPRRGKGPLTRDPDATTGIYSPTGTWGDPTLATRAKGEVIVEALIDHIASAIAALAQPDYAPPPPRERYLVSVAAVVVLVLWSLFLMVGLPMIVASTTAQERRGVEALADELEESVFERRSFFHSPRVEGSLNGRKVRVTGGGELQDGVKVRHGLGDVALGREDLRARLARIPPKSAQALESRAALQHLIGRLGIHMFVLTEDGWLQVRRPSSSHAAKADSLRQVLELLIRLAPLFESRSVQIQVLGDKAARGWTGGGEDILCPFCRDKVGQDALELTACATCRTVHHSECFAEANGCTVFGCSGAPSARVSV